MVNILISLREVPLFPSSQRGNRPAQRKQLRAHSSRTALNVPTSWHALLITNILLHAKKYVFCQPDKKNRNNFDSFTLNIVVLVVVIFLFDNLGEERSVPLTK